MPTCVVAGDIFDRGGSLVGGDNFENKALLVLSVVVTARCSDASCHGIDVKRVAVGAVVVALIVVETVADLEERSCKFSGTIHVELVTQAQCLVAYHVVWSASIEIEGEDGDDEISCLRLVGDGSRIQQRLVQPLELGRFVVDVQDEDAQTSVRERLAAAGNSLRAKIYTCNTR